MVEDTLELGGVQVIAAPPVTGGHSPITQLTLSLAGESDPAPPVLTAVLQPEEIYISRLSLVQRNIFMPALLWHKVPAQGTSRWF